MNLLEHVISFIINRFINRSINCYITRYINPVSAFLKKPLGWEFYHYKFLFGTTL